MRSHSIQEGLNLSPANDSPNNSAGESRRPATTLLSQGAVLQDRYEILRICGRGGMSTVYAARDLRFSHVERLCAVKEMQVAAPDNRTRVLRIANFEREAAMLATLSHPAIPKIFDFFTDGGLIYLVLEFVEGQDLESLIDSTDAPFEEKKLIDWALQILDVLAYLHGNQPEPIVFRDLKPSNIMLRPDGKIAVIDFGIARTFQPLQRGTMIGTEGYAPPEQYRGVAEPRGDIYALGATLHHMATRSDPRAETPFTFDQRQPRDLNPALSEGFVAVINRALAYNAADRFPSATAMAEAIRYLQGNAPNKSWAGEDHPAPNTHSNGQTGSKSSTLEPPTLSSKTSAPAVRRSTTVTSGPVRDRVIWSVQTGDEVRGSASTARAHAQIGSYDGYLYSVSLATGNLAWRFRCQRGLSTRPVLVDDLLIFGSEDQHVYAVRVGDGRMQWSFRTAMAVRSSAAAYGETVIFGSDDSYCYSLDARRGELNWRQRAWGPIRSSPTIHQGNVLFGSDDGAVYRLDGLDGKLIWRFQIGQRVLSSPAADSGIVVVGGFDGAIYGIDFESGDSVWRLQTQRPVVASPRILGSNVFIAGTDGAVYALDIHHGEEVWRSQIANQITSTIGLHSGYGYLGTIDGYVHCLNLSDGDTVWRHRLSKPITSSPAVAEDTVVVGSLDGKIYGLRL